MANGELAEAGEFHGVASGEGFVDEGFEGSNECFAFGGGDAHTGGELLHECELCDFQMG